MPTDRSHREEVSLEQFATGNNPKKLEIADSVGPDGKAVDRKSYLCVAKYLLSKGKSTRYYIKKHNGGTMTFFNPLENDLVSLTSRQTASGREKFDFVSVTEETYNNYVKFLQTKNQIFLRNAERGVN